MGEVTGKDGNFALFSHVFIQDIGKVCLHSFFPGTVAIPAKKSSF